MQRWTMQTWLEREKKARDERGTDLVISVPWRDGELKVLVDEIHTDFMLGRVVSPISGAWKIDPRHPAVLVPFETPHKPVFLNDEGLIAEF